jgi:hypothetical protein
MVMVVDWNFHSRTDRVPTRNANEAVWIYTRDQVEETTVVNKEEGNPF